MLDLHLSGCSPTGPQTTGGPQNHLTEKTAPSTERERNELAAEPPSGLIQPLMADDEEQHLK